MRELVFWGYLNHACLLTDCLIQLVEKNDEGFYTFPEYFKKTNPGSGKELDGTAAVIIGMVHLWKRLPENNYYKNQIYQFLHQHASPLLYIHQKLLPQPLIEGSGEFGGGCGIAGDWYNVVQNNLVRLALIAGADLEKQAGNLESYEIYMNDVEKINENMLKYLADENSTWIWCIDPKTMLPDENIINDPINKGFGGLNGVVSMLADVTGFEPLMSNWAGVKIGQNTLEKLYSFPLRKQQFDKYGIWSQFDEFREGMSSGPSYGDGYALQAMLLLDKMDMVDKSVHWLAGATYSPIAEYHELDRDSPYYFYERYYSPDIVGKMDLEQGCGALNLVNVTEPLKVARLFVGVDDLSNNKVKIIPRVPPSWIGYNVTNWPVYTENGLVTADIRFVKKDDKIIFKLYSNGEIPQLAVRFFTQNEFKWYRWQNVSEIEFVVK